WNQGVARGGGSSGGVVRCHYRRPAQGWQAAPAAEQRCRVSGDLRAPWTPSVLSDGTTRTGQLRAASLAIQDLSSCHSRSGDASFGLSVRSVAVPSRGRAHASSLPLRASERCRQSRVDLDQDALERDWRQVVQRLRFFSCVALESPPKEPRAQRSATLASMWMSTSPVARSSV